MMGHFARILQAGNERFTGTMYWEKIRSRKVLSGANQIEEF